MTRPIVTFILILLSSEVPAYEQSSFWDFHGYVEVGYDNDPIEHKKYDQRDGLAVGATGAYVGESGVAAIGSILYNFKYREFDNAFVGVMYEGLSVTYGVQSMMYDMYSEGDLTYGLGNHVLGRHLGGSVQSNSAKIYYDYGKGSAGVSVGFGDDDIEHSRSIGLVHEIHPDLHISYTGIYTKGSIYGSDTIESESNLLTVLYLKRIYAIALSRESLHIGPWYGTSTFTSGRYYFSPKLSGAASIAYRNGDGLNKVTTTIGTGYEILENLNVSGEYKQHYDLYTDSIFEVKIRYEL